MKIFLRVLYSILLYGASALHFVHEKCFRKIVPEILSLRSTIVFVTGVFEMIFSILLCVKKGQNVTGKLLATYIVAVFPANIYMAVKKISFRPGKQANPWVLWLRLPLQLPLIIGALTLGRRERIGYFGSRNK